MKKIFLGLIVVMVLFLAGCGEGEEAPVVSVFMGGSQGIVASFEQFGIQESGIYTIYDTESFPIEINIKNKGEENIAAGDLVVKLKGINLADFDNIEGGVQSNGAVVEKVSEFNEGGGEEIISFTPNANAQYKHPITGFYQPDVFATIEYKYKTRALVPRVCFKEDLTDSSICTVKEGKEIFVSGAPILVRSVKEDAAGRGIIVLTFDIENAGGGKVTKVGKDFDSRYGQLSFSMKTDPGMWECKSAGRENEARLVDGRATVTCKLKEVLSAGTLYTKQLELELSYVYQTVISESIKIKESI